MKSKIFIFLLSLSLLACNQEKKTVKKEFSIPEKIAYAHGIEHWNEVTQIAFTFNVDKDSTHYERSWIWNPKSNDITSISGNNTISYNRKRIDSTTLKTDQAFINDKYWLLVPFQLVWDKGTTISEVVRKKAPISNNVLNKITLTYADEGGYTPGDAYDLYYSDDFIIKEWVFRKGNSNEPSLINTFENHQNFNGIEIALDHIKNEGHWNLNFTNISVQKNN